MHSTIRTWVSIEISPEIACSMTIQYGGGVNLLNFKELSELDNVDGFLLGRSSLKASEILHIYQGVRSRTRTLDETSRRFESWSEERLANRRKVKDQHSGLEIYVDKTILTLVYREAFCVLRSHCFWYETSWFFKVTATRFVVQKVSYGRHWSHEWSGCYKTICLRAR